MRIIVNKYMERSKTLYEVFMDLQKPHEGRDQGAIWINLRKYGVNYCLMKEIERFY